MIIESSSLVKNPLVSVLVITYNQEEYIYKAIESVLSQQCSFDYEIVIGEDCSKDNTRNICLNYQMKYPGKIKLLLQESNKGLMKNYHDVINLCRGKYIAQCAGDDYWHNPNKLQLQVSFLENNPDYGIIHSDFDELNDRTGEVVKNTYAARGLNIPTGYVFKELFYQYHITAITVCFSKSIFDAHVPFDKFIQMKFALEDRPTFTIMSRYCKVAYSPESTATYRRLSGSVSIPVNFDVAENYYSKWEELSRFLCEMFPEELTFDEKNERVFKNTGILATAFKSNNFQEAKKYGRFLLNDGVKNRRVRYSQNRLYFKLFVFLKKIHDKMQTKREK